MKVIVSNIQRFSLHDGPGIRTTIFLKGCTLRCPWCSNPENLELEIQKYENEGQTGIYGYEIELEELEKQIVKDKQFYETGGGVTFSGGECLLQFAKLEPLLKRLKQKKINICIETSLTVSQELVDIAIKYVDEFIIDIKILEDENVKKINGNVELFKKNIKKVFENNCKVIFRIPLVSKYTVTDNNIEKILNLLSKYRPLKVEIFKIHRLGEKKYKTLGKEMPIFEEIDDKKVEAIKEKIESLEINAEYCKI